MSIADRIFLATLIVVPYVALFAWVARQLLRNHARERRDARAHKDRAKVRWVDEIVEESEHTEEWWNRLYEDSLRRRIDPTGDPNGGRWMGP